MSMLGFLPFSGDDISAIQAEIIAAITWPALDEVDGGVTFGPVTGTEYEGSGVNATTIRTALGLATANLDTQLAARTGYKLASDGLDSIATTAPTGAASNFREMLVQVWRRFFRRATRTTTEIKTFADNGTTVVTTQAISNDGVTETQGTAT